MILAIVLVTGGLRYLEEKGSVKSAQTVSVSPTPFVTPSPPSLGTIATSSAITDVLRAIDESVPIRTVEDTPFPTYTPFPTLTPLVIPTLIPRPTSMPQPTSVLVPSCDGTPTAYNSQVYVSTSTSLVNSQVTISVELLDCHNTLTGVSDSLTISLTSPNGSVTMNGAPLPITIQAQNGKASFFVNSSVSGTFTFVITDTSRSFTVTDPHNHNPSVTFGNNTSGNPNCTTPGGIPNGWFSNVYPSSPVSIPVGSFITFTVDIRDCNKNRVSGTEMITISMSPGDSTTQVNGNNPPYSFSVQNGEGTFTVTSHNPGTNSFVVRDGTSSFTVTDANNHNPSVVFTSTVTPTPTSGPITPTATPPSGASPTQSPTPTQTQSASPTVTPTPKPTTAATPTSTPPSSTISPSPTTGT